MQIDWRVRPSAQLAKLSAVTFTVADLSGNAVGENRAAHIVIDTDAAGHGWFVDTTPSDNSEFAHAENAASNDLSADFHSDLPSLASLTITSLRLDPAHAFQRLGILKPAYCAKSRLNESTQ
jgi:hypothetical protein